MSAHRKDRRHMDSIDYWLSQVKRGADHIVDRMTSARVTDRVMDAVLDALERPSIRWTGSDSADFTRYQPPATSHNLDGVL